MDGLNRSPGAMLLRIATGWLTYRILSLVMLKLRAIGACRYNDA